MGKFLLFLLLAFIVYLLLRSRYGKARARAGGSQPVEDMVACARCGVNIPRSEAVESRGRLFCSDEHRALGPG